MTIAQPNSAANFKQIASHTPQDLEAPKSCPPPDSTVVCQLTASGRGAIAVVSVHGPAAHQAVLANFRPASELPDQRFPLGEIRYGVWTSHQLRGHKLHSQAADSRANSLPKSPHDPISDPLLNLGSTPTEIQSGESVVVIAVTPQSVEIHCHGGKAAVAAILEDLRLASVVSVTPADFDALRGIDPEVAAMDEILQATNTSTTAAIVLTQLRGQLSHKCQELLDRLISADQTSKSAALAELAKLRSFIPAAKHLTVPWNVVIAGPPNVGKSSLINRLLGYQRAITFDAPGTTRDVIVADTAMLGWPMRLSDTAGIRSGDDPLESEGVRRALASIEKADLLLLVVDAASGPTPVHQTLAEQAGRNVLVVWNKIDLTSRQEGVSAKTGSGIAELKQAILDALMPTCPTAEDAVPITNFEINTMNAVVDCQDEAQRIALLSSLIRTSVQSL